jgi:hypothetical protein
MQPGSGLFVLKSLNIELDVPALRHADKRAAHPGLFKHKPQGRTCARA